MPIFPGYLTVPYPGTPRLRATPRRWEMDVTDDEFKLDYPLGQPRAEQFDTLVRKLAPTIRKLSPHLTDIEVLRAAARMAEYRIRDEDELFWGRW